MAYWKVGASDPHSCNQILKRLKQEAVSHPLKESAVFRSLRSQLVCAVAVLGISVTTFDCSDVKTVLCPMNPARVQGVRFDPSYYYNLKQPLDAFIDSMVAQWHAHGINTVFFKAYDPEYGAVYRTNYPHNRETDYGAKDFMRRFLDAAHKNGLRFIVWLPVLEHKGVWDANPQWRMKDENGADLVPFPNRYFVCGNRPEVREWWSGFIGDILDRYPDIDGVDLAEPTVVWKSNMTCSCDECRKRFGAGKAAFSSRSVDARASRFTDLLLSSCSLVREAGKLSCVTIIPTADRSANLLPFTAQKRISGFDPDRLLDVPSHPDWISLELMWQQWADTYDDPATFTPAWTKRAVEQAFSMVAGRAHMIAHVELTPLGPVEVTPGELAESITAARKGGAQSIELYDSHLADSMNAWSGIRDAYETRSDRTVFVFHDSDGLGLGRQIATLFGHFDLRTVIAPIDSFAVSNIRENDLVSYLGTDADEKLPPEFLSFACRPDARLLWMNLNLSHVPRLDSLRHVRVREVRYGKDFPEVLYKGKRLFKTDSIMTILEVSDTAKARVHAWALDREGKRYPYAVQSKNFWYIADCPVDYIAEGCRHIVLADLLHEFVGEDHPVAHTAAVRIEDVCALSDPRAIRRIADLLWSEKVPFAIALVPFYVDPQENIATSLSDKPAMVDALRYAVSKGAAIVMHGSTHQYRGRTTGDYEFWDAVKNGPLFDDSDEYVRVRLQRGLDELHRNGLYPVVFETPHYAASQLDYAVFNGFFSAEYGRRQVIDKKGFDQLVPYLIPHHPDGAMIIPENLGYVPTDNQDAAPLVRFADNNLAVRDGYASFFFHPWIDTKVLRDIVRGIRKKGYRFADIRMLPLTVRGEDFVQTTGSRRITLDVSGKYVHTFFVDGKGRKRDEWYSDGPVAGPFEREITVPPGWIFVAEGVGGRPSLFPGLSGLKKGWLGKIKGWLFSAAPLKPPHGDAARVWVLWDGSERRSSQYAFYKTFKECAIPVDSVEVKRFFGIPDSINLVVVPQTSARRLSSQQSLIIAQSVAAGKKIILEGPSDLARRVGIRVLDSSGTIRQIKDDYFPGVPVSWKEPSVCYRFEADVEYVTQYSTADDRPVAAGGEYGEGMYLFFASHFAGSDGEAANRYPFFLDMLERQFDCRPQTRRAVLEVYFDPGTREDAAPEDLVRLWRANGVRVVHVAAWLDQADFDYGGLVDLLHRNGMLGYAWFSLPFISEEFWRAHPRWREVTAAGTPAHIGWRFLMNITNDTCRAGVFNAVKRCLMLADWDGVNLSGNLFEGERPDQAALVTPMNASVRSLYVREKGYDPVLLFDEASRYSFRENPVYWNDFKHFRDSLETAILDESIKFIGRQRALQKPGRPIVITRSARADDSARLSPLRRFASSEKKILIQLSPVLPEGIDAAALLKYVNTIRQGIPHWDPMVELDFDALRPKSEATSQLCGAELMGLVAAANARGVRLSLRTEENIFDVDFKALPYAAASGANVHVTKNALIVENRATVAIELDAKKVAPVTVDGMIWPVYSRGSPLMPGGTHTLAVCSRFNKWKSMLFSPVRILDFAGSVSTARPTVQGLRFSYCAEAPSPLVLSHKAHTIIVDGLPSGPINDEGTVTMLPAGRHDVSVTARSISGVIVRQASIGLSGAIVVVSSFTIGVFLMLYAGARVLRMTRKFHVNRNG